MKNILIINGSITGINGNTNQVIEHALKEINSDLFNVQVLNLNTKNYDLEDKLKWADGFIFSSGTYWDSWGSPLQKFFEDITPFEATPLLLFKPCAVIVTMHAFGGKEVLSRIQGVLNTMGLLIPPMSGMVYGLAIQEALSKSESFARDFWSLDDLEIIIHNLQTAILKKSDYLAWPVDRKDPKRRWITCET